jgi:hypothetical protein
LRTRARSEVAGQSTRVGALFCLRRGSCRDPCIPPEHSWTRSYYALDAAHRVHATDATAFFQCAPSVLWWLGVREQVNCQGTQWSIGFRPRRAVWFCKNVNTMERRELDIFTLSQSEDWEGNNAAFTCPLCAKVFIVSGLIHKKGRLCPGCRRCTGYVSGSKAKSGRAWIEWDDSAPDQHSL